MSDSSADVDEIRGRLVIHASNWMPSWTRSIDAVAPSPTLWVAPAGISGMASFKSLAPSWPL